MNAGLTQAVRAELAQAAPPFAVDFAMAVARRFDDPLAVLFYGSILRTGDRDGVLDFYVLTAAPPKGLRGLLSRLLWPDVSYLEIADGERPLRAKVAAMTLAQFQAAVTGDGLDTTVWTRFVQPAALVWSRDETVRDAVEAAVAQAAVTAARFAAALGPARGEPSQYWDSLFRETYAAEFRVETSGRGGTLLAADPARYDRLLALAWRAAGIEAGLSAAERARLLAAWRLRRAMGRPLNIARLIKAAFTFDGAARYAAWKIERHTGVAVPLTPWRERHPILAAPGVLWRLRRARRKGRA